MGHKEMFQHILRYLYRLPALGHAGGQVFKWAHMAADALIISKFRQAAMGGVVVFDHPLMQEIDKLLPGKQQF